MLLGVALAVILLRQGRGREAEQMRQQLALALSQQADTVQRVERSLREQEQALTKVVHERLDRTEKATGQIVTDLRERLVRIDEAQKKIGDLSTQVVSLQEVLSNKQARGAFGEVQLNDLVQNALPPQAYAFQHTLTLGGPRRLPAASAQSAGLDRHRRQVPAGKLQRAERRGGGRRRRPAGRAARLPAGHPQAYRRHPRQVHRVRRDRRNRR